MAEPKGPFEYKYKWWDKNRPGTLPSTGLGAALKDYEAAQKKLDSSDGLAPYYAAKAALNEAEKAREKAVKKCGVLHKPIKKILEAADADQEAAALIEAFEPTLDKMVSRVESRAVEVKRSIEGSKKTADEYLDNLDDPKVLESVEKLLRSVKESSFPIKGTSDLGSDYPGLLNGRAMLKRDFPDLTKRIDKVKDQVDEAMSTRSEYLKLLKMLGEEFLAKRNKK